MTDSLASNLGATEIHRRLAGRWPVTLEQLGVPPEHLRNRHGPCPGCDGTDRYRFDDRHLRGDFYCNGCGAGDAFKLLQLVHGWTFAEARNAVLGVLGVSGNATAEAIAQRTPTLVRRPEVAGLTARVRDLLRTCTTPDMVADAVAYLDRRRLWPLPDGCTWRAHVGIDYLRPTQGKAFELVGRFAALVAPVVDVNGDAVTAHVTYLADGRKAAVDAPRKIISKMTGRQGCAVRLLPLAGDVLGVAEGIETALAASILHGDAPVWAALNTSMLAKFVPPPAVRHVLIFADRDVAGLEAAWALRDELDGRCTVELRTPPAPANDWADVMEARRA